MAADSHSGWHGTQNGRLAGGGPALPSQLAAGHALAAVAREVAGGAVLRRGRPAR